ncbi:protein kinase domain-containing protein [Actinomadura rupiterrae]|uniref:protein kinase domain-containing protein n=1 Tax=Actinomadura rupiterrae TaxID=559627 RepID=UPI0020A3CAB9|nr:protein kinase [Actinomadura rupiterrae]MCP2339246.1 serine/threonine protein kinase [Actinomadura rupiterrae]
MDRLITHLGLDTDQAKLLHDRRGTTVYRIGDLALKITDGLMAAREGEILKLLGTEFYRDHGWDGDDHGPDGDRSWLLLRWIDGATLWCALEPAHRSDSQATRSHALACTRDAAVALAELHAAGWAHGDLQPDHVLFEGDRTHLIDLACAQHPAVAVPPYVHRGGLAHTTAPEIAAAILASEEHITATPQADIWSLGASLWWSWTRTPPITYTDSATGRPGQLANIAALHRAPATARSWPFRVLEEIITACLAADPADRPTAKEIAASLAS